MDLSLDEIIKKKNIKVGAQKLKGRPPQNGRRNMSTGRVNKPVQNNNARVTRPLRRTNSQITDKPRFADARMRIIQKNRQRMTDARDKLSELAKQTDARNKIKGRNPKLTIQPNGRTDRGRINRDNFIRNLKPAPLLKRSIRNNNVTEIADPASLMRTINRPNINFVARTSPLYVDDFDMPSPMRPRTDLGGIKVVTQNDYIQYNQEYVPELMLVDRHDPPVFRRHIDNTRGGITVPRRGSGGGMSLELRSRLDNPKPPPAYIYPPPSHSPPPSGHRIVVSNLHTSVTHEDIKELFEDIGPLLISRLLKPGVAEVIYKHHNDAKSAVEAYHNRQLDGQPMKCMLVNPRSPPSGGGVLRSNNIPAAPKYPSSSKSMVVPDLTAIHKALFTNK